MTAVSISASRTFTVMKAAVSPSGSESNYTNAVSECSRPMPEGVFAPGNVCPRCQSLFLIFTLITPLNTAFFIYLERPRFPPRLSLATAPSLCSLTVVDLFILKSVYIYTFSNMFISFAKFAL